MYGRSGRGPMQIIKELWTNDSTPEEVKSTYEYVIDLHEKLDETMQIVRQNLNSAYLKSKKYFDKKAKSRKFLIGDKILMLTPNRKNKLQMMWEGPYEIVAKVHENDYKIKMSKNKTRTYHANMLKIYISREQINKEETIVASFIDYDEEQVHHEEILDNLETSHNEFTINCKINHDLNHENHEKITDILTKYSTVFTEKLKLAKIEKHSIPLTDNIPVVSKPYPVPYRQREKLKDEMQNMEDEGIIRKSNSPYASPVVIVQKKDSTLRICPDYRKLNKLSIFDPEPMVSSEDLLIKLKTSSIFTKLDLCKGYWQVPMKESDIPKTAFVTQDGHYEFTRMPFGLTNSGATLVIGLRKILGNIDNVVIYMDDILIFNYNWDDHLKTVEEVFLKKLKQANVTIKPLKSFFAKSKIEFIGFEHR